MPDINYIGLLLAIVAGFAVSFLWYGVLFGGLWQKLSGTTQEDVEKDLRKIGLLERQFLHVIGLVVGGFVLSYFIGRNGNTTSFAGMVTGFLIWVVAAMVLIFGGILSRTSRKENIYVVALDLTHWLVVFMVMAGVLAVVS